MTSFSIDPDIQALAQRLQALRHELHQHPQTAYEETYIAGRVQDVLKENNIPFRAGYGQTGFVATVQGRSGTNGPRIGLRADMDALDINEQSGQPWASTIPGKMHGCGHDGHTTILLGAALHLARKRDFDGVAHFFFQPAEECRRGADAMISDGALKDFPVDAMFGLHNWPFIPFGKAETRVGPMLALNDNFEITLRGKAGHAAYIADIIDPLPGAVELVSAIQTIVSRTISPTDPALVSVSNFHFGNGAFNSIEESVRISGVVRCFSDDISAHISKRLRELADNIARAHRLQADVTVTRVTDCTINTPDEYALACDALTDLMGEANVNRTAPLCMGCEDFGSFLRHVPGAYVFLGQGMGGDTPYDKGLHSPLYDFNDGLIPVGVQYFTNLVERFCAK